LLFAYGVAIALVVSVVAAVGRAQAQSDPIGQLQSAATGAATSATGLIVAVVIITAAIAFGLWGLGKVRGR
jgi:hypothetical protein